MKRIPILLRRFAPVVFLFAVTFEVVAFGGLGGQKLPDGGLALSVGSETRWRVDGGGAVEVRIDARSAASEARAGELRLVLVGVNGRIDFDAVTVRLDRDSAQETLPAEFLQPSKGVLVISDL